MATVKTVQQEVEQVKLEIVKAEARVMKKIAVLRSELAATGAIKPPPAPTKTAEVVDGSPDTVAESVSKPTGRKGSATKKGTGNAKDKPETDEAAGEVSEPAATDNGGGDQTEF